MASQLRLQVLAPIAVIAVLGLAVSAFIMSRNKPGGTDADAIAARIAAFASPGQLLATQPVADIAAASGVVTRNIGKVALRSIADSVSLHSIEFAPAFDPGWIDPVCKMLAPYAAYRRTTPTEPWFCSSRCTEAYRRSPEIYASATKASNPARLTDAIGQ
jgi:YHS domain-containing protein